MLHDHLEGGKYHNPSEILAIECASVPNANTNPETDFGFLDRLKIMKPNSNDITLEAIIMCRSNRMSFWRDHLTEFDKNMWMNWVKSCKKDHYKMFVERRAEIKKLRNEKRLVTIEGRRMKEVRIAQAKEEVSKEINDYGGLWGNADIIDANLANLKDDRKKVAALKCQLKYRQKVLGHTFVDSDLYIFSRNKVDRTSVQLCENLKKVIHQFNLAKTSVSEPCVNNLVDIVIPMEKIDKEKLRLEMIRQKENISIEKSKKKTLAWV